MDRQTLARRHRSEHRGSPAFTMVELLVVMGIIAMLAALLLPILSKARERAKTVTCASNLNQVGAGLEMYNQVHKQLPLDGTPAGLSRAMEEMNIGGVMVCPSDPGGPPSYTMNAAFAGMPKSAGNPTDVLASESGNRHTAGPNILYFDGHVEEKQQ